MTTPLYKEIGGYFGLELNQQYNNIKNAVALNSARNCLRYVIKAYNITEIHLPQYTCPVVWQAVQKEGCKIKFYHIDKNFMPICEFKEDDYIVYTNYFGVCTNNVKILSKKYKNLIVDNAQSFYTPRYGLASFNSIRKFFGVSDGALLYCDKRLNTEFEQDTSYQRFSHLLKRIDISAKFGYNDFVTNDDSLINDNIKTISKLTKEIFNSIDTEEARKKRIENYNYLSDKLTEINELNLSPIDAPMVYPLLIKQGGLREKLIKNNIYVAQYWSPVNSDSLESELQQYLLPLPIDQRYDINDMKKIIEVININNIICKNFVM